MNSQHEPTENTTSSPAANIRTLCSSAAVSVACFALYFAEDHGFRIFEESMHGTSGVEFNVPSPLEVLTLLGVTSVGVCAGLVAAISLGALLIRLVRHLRIAAAEDAAAMAEDRAHHGTA